MKTISFLSGVVFIIAFVPYVLAIVGRAVRWDSVRHRMRLAHIEPIEPKTVSWIIWGSLDFITLAGMIAKNSVNGQIVGACVGVTVVIGFAMKFGKAEWTRLDKITLAGAVLAIVLWKLSGDPVTGIVTSCLVAFFGSLPTFTSAWKNPGNESKLAWTIFWISCVLAVIAIPAWTLEDAAQPMTFFIIETTMMGILFVRPLMARLRIA